MRTRAARPSSAGAGATAAHGRRKARIRKGKQGAIFWVKPGRCNSPYVPFRMILIRLGDIPKTVATIFAISTQDFSLCTFALPDSSRFNSYESTLSESSGSRAPRRARRLGDSFMMAGTLALAIFVHDVRPASRFQHPHSRRRLARRRVLRVRCAGTRFRGSPRDADRSADRRDRFAVHMSA